MVKKKKLVTGGTGFIGSHTVVELQQHGYEVVIIDNLSNSSIDVLDNIEKISGIMPVFEQLDLADALRTADFLKRHADIVAEIDHVGGRVRCQKSVVEQFFDLPRR